MTPAIAEEFRHTLNAHGDKLESHGESIGRLDERDKARDASLQRIEGNVTWLIRGVILVLLAAIGDGAAILFKK
jgi:hypothetical protein